MDQQVVQTSSEGDQTDPLVTILELSPDDATTDTGVPHHGEPFDHNIVSEDQIRSVIDSESVSTGIDGGVDILSSPHIDDDIPHIMARDSQAVNSPSCGLLSNDRSDDENGCILQVSNGLPPADEDFSISSMSEEFIRFTAQQGSASPCGDVPDVNSSSSPSDNIRSDNSPEEVFVKDGENWFDFGESETPENANEDDEWGDFAQQDEKTSVDEVDDWGSFEKPAQASAIPWDESADEVQKAIAKCLYDVIPEIERLNLPQNFEMEGPKLSDLLEKWNSGLITSDGRLKPLASTAIFYQSPLCDMVFSDMGCTETPQAPFQKLRRKFSLHSDNCPYPQAVEPGSISWLTDSEQKNSENEAPGDTAKVL
uniref:Uncharacterized protein n=1 Tax=Spongospora subterranea TaxID=70186 RepID=A0A0H5RA98_9EUKA|eukprot:CRZ10721.1 hypothetical protein [Spongospora subterranea]